MLRRLEVASVAAMIFSVLALGAPVASAQGNPGGPGCGYGGMMGPGMMGPGMMGPGMMGPGGPAWGGSQPGVSLTMDQAISAAQGYVSRLGNPDLALDEAMEFECNIYFAVKERSTGIGAFELLVSRFNGAIFPEPGPNMMWNTKYGHMGGMMGPGGMMSGWVPSAPSTASTMTTDQAGTVAQQWLDQYLPGSTTEPPDPYYGYYTIDFQRDGSVSGMLSVNAYTGQVWYHNWHGAFIGMKDLDQ